VEPRATSRTREHASPEHHAPDAKLGLLPRLRLIGQGLRSSLKRYPRAISSSPASSTASAEAVTAPLSTAEFRDAWDRLPSHAGLTGVAWLGHASVLVKFGGRTLLVDPVTSTRVGPRVGGRIVGPRRLAPAPIAARDLPRPDLVLITHAHYDHLDRATLRALARRSTIVITAARTRRLVPRGFGQVTELGWRHELETLGLHISAIRPRHWGARTAVDRYRGYNSYLVRDARSTLLLGGDTAYTRAFDGLGPIDLAVMGIGAYDPWHHAHATPEQVWAMARAMPARRLMPMHYATFPLSDEPLGAPLERLRAAASEPDLPDRAESATPSGEGQTPAPRLLDAPLGVVVPV
jgi:L-ascorbate metabolism protein UlaG (beta-lactamase superfamily)